MNLFLGSGPFKCIIPSSVSYFRYIDILFIYLQHLNSYSITDRLNNVEPSKKFTCGLECSPMLVTEPNVV